MTTIKLLMPSIVFATIFILVMYIGYRVDPKLKAFIDKLLNQKK